MICDTCGCRDNVVRTTYAEGKVVRRRRCMKCGRAIITEEKQIPAAQAEAPPKKAKSKAKPKRKRQPVEPAPDPTPEPASESPPAEPEQKKAYTPPKVLSPISDQARADAKARSQREVASAAAAADQEERAARAAAVINPDGLTTKSKPSKKKTMSSEQAGNGALAKAVKAAMATAK